MEKVLDFIKQNNMVARDEVVGVAVSGGRDSMALLHFLNTHKDSLNIDVVAINIDHCIRTESAMDSQFVKEYCAEHHIRLYNFRLDVIKISVEQKMSLETAARDARYNTFEALIKKGLVDKVALGHHRSDQVETILENIFRGASTTGARGMEPVRDGIYIRPFLNTTREDITKYCFDNNLQYVEDSSNADVAFTRNFIRNELMPLIKQRFKGAEKNILSFATSCAEDDQYINSMVDTRSMIYYDGMIKIPMTFFHYPTAIINRILMETLKTLSKKIGNIERKHINILRSFALESENGLVINLPNGIKAHKEYDYMTITTLSSVKLTNTYLFKAGKVAIPGFGQIKVSSSKIRTAKPGYNIIDGGKLPEGAEWRYRKEGDSFCPFGATGGKKLKDYFIDKKVPQRLRDNIPVLAFDDVVYVIAGIEIADSIKVTDESENIYKISYERDMI